MFDTYRYSMDFYQNDWSPRSTSGYSSSAPSTPPLPPYDLNTEADDITDDNIYSPICSDTEYDDKSDGKFLFLSKRIIFCLNYLKIY